MNLNRCYNVGKYEISEFCLQTYPCKHHFTNTENGIASTMTGDKIFCILRDDGLSHPHFNSYAEFIRKRDNPTPEEIYEKETHQKKMAEMREQQRKKLEEMEKLTNTYKASSRLDKLKLQHNII